MSCTNLRSISRRGILTGLLASLAMPLNDQTTAGRIAPAPIVDLGHGLEIRDYRLFPTDDAMRFIVEIHNTTNRGIDTPEVGFFKPHSTERENYGWAVPVTSVIYPRSSSLLIGIAPAAVASDSDWEGVQWMLCNEVTTDNADFVSQWNLELTSQLELTDSVTAKAMVHVTNHGVEQTSQLSIQGLVWDDHGRLCGATGAGLMAGLRPNMVFETGFTIGAQYPSNHSPFNIIDTIEGITVEFWIEPMPEAINAGCGLIMPWNREN